MITGKFTEEMVNYFDCECGAYTSFTEEELRKSTYNVKAVIRDLLIEKLGRNNIPVARLTKNQLIEFSTCPKTKGYREPKIFIPCKFSKTDKDEMTIYFNKNLINVFQAGSNDVWYIYFRRQEKQPYFGIISYIKWRSMFEEVVNIGNKEEIKDELDVYIDLKQISIFEVDAPKMLNPVKNDGNLINSVTPEVAGKREKDKKILGNKGEDIVMEIERRRLKRIGREDLVALVTNVARKKDGLGYDIISVDVDETGKEQEIFIEVKATRGDIRTPIPITAREVDVSEKMGDAYYIYRLFDITEKYETISYYRVQGAITDNFDLEVTNYRARYIGKGQKS